MSASPFMREALELAHESVRGGGGPFGAVVVRDGRVVGGASNRVVLDADPTAHAEVLAIRRAASTLGTHDLSGCELYTSCEPCPMCLGAILWARISRVHQACDRTDAEAAGFDDARFHAAVGGEGALEVVEDGREEGLGVFDAWRTHAGRTPY